MDGELLAEYAAGTAPDSPQKEYGYRAGELLVTAENPLAAQSVGWMNAVGVNAAGSNLSKPSTGAVAWDAGAMTTRAITSGDGYVEFSAAENNTSRMIGLSTGDTNQQYAEIDFALYPYSDGNMYVYEQGAYVTNLGPYAASDRYRISIEASVIKYRKNGTVLYTSAGAAQYPLLADTSFYTPGASLSGVKMAGQQVENVGWTNAAGVTATGNNLIKTGVDGWTSGAVSGESIAAGDGYVEFTAIETNKSRMLGLSHGDAGQSYTDIDFALYAYSDATLHAYEGGTYAGYLGTYAAGDRLRVAVVGGQIKYLKNGVVIGASNTVATYPLAADTSLYHTGASVTNVTMSGGGQSTGTTVQWLVSDHLGTPRMVADLSGSLTGIRRHDYLPFGEELPAGTGERTAGQGYALDIVRQQFTGQERDTETGLDYFIARYFSAGQGRFISADSVQGSANNPQTLNLYAYVQNSPLKFIDPTGHSAQIPDMWWRPNTAVDYRRLINSTLYNLLGIESPTTYAEVEAQDSQAAQGYEPIDMDEAFVSTAYIEPFGISGKPSLNSVTFTISDVEQARSIFGEASKDPFKVILHLKLPKGTTEVMPSKAEKFPDRYNKNHIIEMLSGSRVIQNSDKSNFYTSKGIVKFTDVDYGARGATATFELFPRAYTQGHSNSVYVSIMGKTRTKTFNTRIRVTILPPQVK